MKFEGNRFYHLYNRGNNRERIFFDENNYIFFLKKLRKHLNPFVDVVAYCLMPNHFHLMIYTNSPGDSESPGELSKQITDAIAVILRSYTRAVNKKFNRTGSLFQQSTKSRALDEALGYPFICFHYIHQNPIKAGLVKDIVEWKFSSYLDYAGVRAGTLCQKELAYEYLDVPYDTIDFQVQSRKVQVDNTIFN